MANEITDTGTPDWLKGQQKVGNVGNVDQSDMIIPRVKIIHSTSPENVEFADFAKIGEFWLGSLQKSLGAQLIGTPIRVRKYLQLWHPRVPGVDNTKPLATSQDTIHWDEGGANQVFEVRFPKNPTIYKWATKGSVRESGLDRFGSSQPDIKDSPPAASLTYDFLFALESPIRSLVLLTLSKSGVRAAKEILSVIQMDEIDHFYRRWTISIKRRAGPTGESYYTYAFARLDGTVTQEQGALNRQLFEHWIHTDYKADDSGQEEPAPQPQQAYSHHAADADDPDSIPF